MAHPKEEYRKLEKIKEGLIIIFSEVVAVTGDWWKYFLGV